MEMSINRALAELKLLNKKITDKTMAVKVAVGVKQNGLVVEAKDAFIKEQTAVIQQIKDLIARRNSIKSAIVASNAVTTVSIGGKSMTVAEAIDRKSAIELEKSLNRVLRERYYGAKSSVEQQNDKASQAADKQANAAMGAQTEGDKGAQYKSIYDAYYDLNKCVVLAPEGIEKMIEKADDEVAEFEKDVDFILSESNTKTVINV